MSDESVPIVNEAPRGKHAAPDDPEPVTHSHTYTLDVKHGRTGVCTCGATAKFGAR